MASKWVVLGGPPLALSIPEAPYGRVNQYNKNYSRGFLKDFPNFVF